MIIVTGGAGFIGSCVVRTLNDAGIEDIVIVDNIGDSNKWLNIRNKKYLEYIHKFDFFKKLPDFERGGGRGNYPHGGSVFHNGKEF